MSFIRKYARAFCLVAGALLILSALGVLLFDLNGKKQMRYDAEKALSKVEELLPEIVDTFPEERSKDYMPAMEIDGLNVAGVIEVPGYRVKLPIRATWDKDAVSSLPCRYTGSVYNGTLIIGADGSEEQFGCASKLDVGDLFYLTDMEGSRYKYTVCKIEHAQSATAERLQEGDWDLTVFVKQGRSEYLLVRLNID